MPHLLNKRKNTMGMHKAEGVVRSSFLANLAKLTSGDEYTQTCPVKYIQRSLTPKIGMQVQLTFKGSLLRGQLGYVTAMVETSIPDMVVLVEFENGAGVVARKCPLSHLNLNPLMFDDYRRKFGLLSAVDRSPLGIEEYKDDKEG